MSDQVMVHKLTLSTSKVVYLRDPLIKDQEMAAQLAGSKAGDNNLATAVLLQKEMVKLLLIQIDEKKLQVMEKEDLDKLFSLREYTEVCKAINHLVGDAGAGKSQMEFVTAGSL